MVEGGRLGVYGTCVRGHAPNRDGHGSCLDRIPGFSCRPERVLTIIGLTGTDGVTGRHPVATRTLSAARSDDSVKRLELRGHSMHFRHHALLADGRLEVIYIMNT